MTKRNYPIIKLTSQSIRGNYYGAYASTDEKLQYQIFISHTEGIHDTCECLAYVHGVDCYHLIRAKEIEVVILA